MLDRISEIIHRYRSFLITAHVRPDGDALGSELALYHVLRNLGKEALIFNQDKTPENYEFLPGSGDIVNELSDPGKYEVVFVLDCSDLERIGEPAAIIGEMPLIVNIDHHISNVGVWEVAYIDRDASSTGEMIYRLIRRLGVRITPEIANNLFGAIMTDTGGFRYGSTQSETLHTAGHLVENGANPQWLSENIYENNPLSKTLLLCKALEALSLELDGRVASMVVSIESLVATGAKSEYIEGFVDLPRTIKGVVVSIVYLELERGHYKLSLRSKGRVNVEQVARRFGGGGHLNAAACKIRGELGDVKRQVVEAIRAVL